MHNTVAEHTEIPFRTALEQQLARVQQQRLEQQLSHDDDIAALTRLLNVARRGTGQSGVVARFLLSLYNGDRFKVDLTDFRRLDSDLFDDCLRVLRMDNQPAMEVHCYFENGGQIFEKLAKDWHVTDYAKQRRSAA